MNQPPLNPEALANLRLLADRATEEVRHAVIEPDILHKLLDIAVTQSEVTSVEELAQLPIGSAVLSEKYIAQQEAEEYPCVFQKLYTGDWHRGGRSSDTHPDYFLPTRVLYRPEVKP